MGRISCKRKKGSMLMEVLVGLFIFTTALLPLASAMMLALRGIKESGDRIAAQQEAVNSAVHFLAERANEHDNSASDNGAKSVDNKILTLSGVSETFSKNIKIYKFTTSGDSYAVYTAEVEN